MIGNRSPRKGLTAGLATQLKKVRAEAADGTPAIRTAGDSAGVLRSASEPSADSCAAAEVKALVQSGRLPEARERFGAIVASQQRRASRIAYHFLRNAAEADEAVQEAFVKVFFHIEQFQEGLPFEVWFTRILINGCLDRQKVRRRRERWLISALDASADDRARVDAAVNAEPSPEDALLTRERRARVVAALDRLPARQRTVLFLCLFGERSPRDVSQITGLNQSTVRVHLFRAIRKLRTLLEGTCGC
jgi:RNA polymerase sigma-70 factor, ECF subfamily